jgi:hypothetical protein
LLIFKSAEFYTIKEKNFWLSQEWDDVHNETIDNTPQFVLPLIIAGNCFTFNQRPHGRRAELNPEKNYYRVLVIQVFLGYYQLNFRCNLELLPYKTHDEYIQFKKDNR